MVSLEQVIEMQKSRMQLLLSNSHKIEQEKMALQCAQEEIQAHLHDYKERVDELQQQQVRGIPLKVVGNELLGWERGRHNLSWEGGGGWLPFYYFKSYSCCGV